MTREEAIKILNTSDYLWLRPTENEFDALNMAIDALEQEPIIQCEECKHHGTSNCPMWGDDTTEDYMWCCDGEKMEGDTK